MKKMKNINKNRKKCVLNYKNLDFYEKLPNLELKDQQSIRKMKKLYKNMINIQYTQIILKHMNNAHLH